MPVAKIGQVLEKITSGRLPKSIRTPDVIPKERFQAKRLISVELRENVPKQWVNVYPAPEVEVV
jgi:hypothetical protein